MPCKHKILYNNVQDTGLIDAKFQTVLFTLLLLRGQIFPKAHSARKGGPSSVRQ